MTSILVSYAYVKDGNLVIEDLVFSKAHYPVNIHGLTGIRRALFEAKQTPVSIIAITRLDP